MYPNEKVKMQNDPNVSVFVWLNTYIKLRSQEYCESLAFYSYFKSLIQIIAFVFYLNNCIPRLQTISL